MKIDVKHTAKLANLKIKDSEIQIFEKQLDSILNYIEKLENIDTKQTNETSQVTGLENITRDDKTVPSQSQEETLSNTKSKHNGLFKVSAIFEET